MRSLPLKIIQPFIILIIFLCLIACTERQNKETDSLIYGKSKEHIDSIFSQEHFVKLNNKCDSIVYIPKTFANPADELYKTIQDKDIQKLDKYISQNVALSSDFSSKEEMYKEWKAYNRESTFWDYLKGYFNFEGTYLNDSIYVTPVLSQVDNTCSIENKLFVLSIVLVYREPNESSEIIIELPKNKVVSYDPSKTIIPFDKYERMKYNSIEEFDDDIWYYLVDYDGYVNNKFVFDAFYSSTMYFKKEQSGKWILSDFIHFD
ncbi:MAG: hypothetical protein ACK5MD_02115 [Flavobacteriales bacterium]